MWLTWRGTTRLTGAVIGAAAAAVALAGCGSDSTAKPSTSPATSAATSTAAGTTPSTTTPAPTTTTTAGPIAAFAGTYKGSWSNTTFGSTGPATIVITTDPGAPVGSPIVTTVTLGGNVFGGSAPAPETYSGVVSASGATFSGTSAVFGTLTWTMADDGTITVTGVQVPGGSVSSFSATGTIAGGSIKVAYKVQMKSGQTAVGTFSVSS